MLLCTAAAPSYQPSAVGPLLGKMTQAMTELDENGTGDLEHGAKTVLATLVLYRMCADESPAYCSLQRLRRQDGEIGRRIALLLWDNSPVVKPAPASLQIGGSAGVQDRFHRDTRNPGLAAAYAEGLRQAAEEGVPWLLLLDQDTEVTAAFLLELFSSMDAVGDGVDAIVPRLMQAGVAVSPLLPRRMGPPAVFTGPDGIFRGRVLQAFNSGAAFRVAALQRMGGFDVRFPLDYLDHATFAALQRAGGRVFALQAAIGHSLSTNTGQRSTATQRERQRSILAAERRFYRLYGSFADRALHSVRLVRRAASESVKKRDLAGAWVILRSLF